MLEKYIHTLKGRVDLNDQKILEEESTVIIGFLNGVGSAYEQVIQDLEEMIEADKKDRR